MGFSPWGLVVAVAMLAPSLILWVWPPRTPMPVAQVPGILVGLERVGQVLCVIVASFMPPGAVVPGWAAPMLLAIVGYYALWARYFVRGRTAKSLYEPWWIVPAPLAIFPVVGFVSAAGWLSSPWLALSAAILAAGHIPASARRSRAVLARP